MVNDPRHPVGSQEIDARLHRCSEAIARPGVKPLDTATLGPVKFDPSKPKRHSDEALEAARSWYARTFVSDRAAVMRGERDGAPFLQGYAYAYDDLRQPLAVYIRDPAEPDHVERVPLAEGLECAELKPPCPKGPVGWRCTRGLGHDGPCAAVPVGGCPHIDRKPGPRIPLAYGSASTLVCQACGSWRQDRPGFSDRDWQPPAELERALANDDSDR